MDNFYASSLRISQKIENKNISVEAQVHVASLHIICHPLLWLYIKDHEAYIWKTSKSVPLAPHHFVQHIFCGFVNSFQASQFVQRNLKRYKFIKMP